MGNREKHLEFVLSAISRMAQNSFLARGWSITLTTAFLAVAANTDIKIAYALASVPIVVFWVVDAYYLSMERRYRLLFDHVRSMPAEDIDYGLDTRAFKQHQGVLVAMVSPLVTFIYGSMVCLVSFLFYAQGSI